MGSFVGIVITVAALLGGFAAMGGHLGVLMQPWEFVIIVGTAVGTFIVANPWRVIVDTGLAAVQGAKLLSETDVGGGANALQELLPS